MENTQLNEQQTSVEDTKNREALHYEQVEGTIFAIKKGDTGKWAGIMGRYIITEETENKEKLIEELKVINWERILQVINIVLNYKDNE